MKFRQTSAAFAIFIAGLGVSAAYAKTDITYTIDRKVGDVDSVVGTITTDGTLGVLSQADIVSSNLELNGNGASYNLVQGTNSIVTISGDAVTADAKNLYFNFGDNDGDYLLFQNGGQNGQEYYCDKSSPAGNCLYGESVVPVYYSDTSSQFNGAVSGNTIIASAAVPEPAIWAMLLLGFFGVGGIVRGARRKDVAAVA